MKIKTNNYVNSFNNSADKSLPQASNKENNKSETKPASNRTDTITISVAGKEFTARKKESDSEMFAAEIDDLDSFRSALKSMSNLEVNWNAVVDPYGTFAGAARVEAIYNLYQDPNAPKNIEDRDKLADQYVQNRINSLIEKKKAYIASQPENYMASEAEEYKIAYDAYHSENGSSLIANMAGDTKKAYNIYKSILDGDKASLDDQEFLMLYNNTMYRGAKGEYYQKPEEMHNK
ncbi:MAG: hypothetical protein NC320_02260 [Clostridium sp.]|nr:hypothetical protein [Clostridium sp.]